MVMKMILILMLMAATILTTLTAGHALARPVGARGASGASGANGGAGGSGAGGAPGGLGGGIVVCALC
jgi:hypothetical protein